MIRTLIVDDNHKKVKEIRDCLVSVGIQIEDIDVVTDIVEGRKKLKSVFYDLLILDIQIPERVGENPLINGGLQILELLKDRYRYKKPGYIIGLTEFSDSMKEYKTVFEEKLRFLIKFEEASTFWKTKLNAIVSEIKETKKFSPVLDYDYDVGFVCALEKTELENVLKLEMGWTPIHFPSDNLIYHIGKGVNSEGREYKIVAASCEQMGMSSAAVTTTKLIHHFRPKYIFMTGIAGAVEDSLNFGDIIIADPCWDYGDGKYVEINGANVFEESPYQLRAPVSLLSIVNRIRVEKDFLFYLPSTYKQASFKNPISVYIEPLVSGSAVIASFQQKNKIKSLHRKIYAVDMEAFGFLYAANHALEPRPFPLVVKSISDMADTTKNDFAKDYAAYTSTQFVFKMIKEFIEFEKG
ncbi:hypothetical protein AB0X74_04550 [Kurthia gibsonii]|uniref:phosphorylase family protein n=1 Tax=Kurthia gibsonii TaxID=33946 RepID=UPI003F26C321